MTESGFGGIPADAVAFYAELADNNSRPWWQANKERYEVNVRDPIAELVDLLAADFAAPQVFRPHRDVRFSADKAPYKEHQGAFARTTDATGWYLQVSADGLLTAGGSYHLAPDQLARYRAAVDDDRSGAELVTILDQLRAAGYAINGEQLKTRPRGVPEDHPRLDLLRHKTLTAGRDHGTPAWMSRPEVVTRVREDWSAMRGLVDWLTDHVGPTSAPSRGR